MGNVCNRGVQTGVAPEVAAMEQLKLHKMAQTSSHADPMPSGTDIKPNTSTNTPFTTSFRKEKLASPSESSVFWCIQTQSTCKWGLQHSIMRTMQELGLEVVDHRTYCCSRTTETSASSIVMNEVFVKDYAAEISDGASDTRVQVIEKALTGSIGQSDAKVLVQPWIPRSNTNTNAALIPMVTENDTNLQTAAYTRDEVPKPNMNAATTLDCLPLGSQSEDKDQEAQNSQRRLSGEENEPVSVGETPKTPPAASNSQTTQKRRRRHKTKSTRVGGGGLFGESNDQPQTIFETTAASNDPSPQHGRNDGQTILSPTQTRLGFPAEVRVNEETFGILINSEALRTLKDGGQTQSLESPRSQLKSATIQAVDAPVVSKLSGYVRKYEVDMIPEVRNPESSEFIMM